MKKGRIIAISGPSGVGKTTLYRRLLDEFSGELGFSVSATTRNPRGSEKNGEDYYFITKEDFEKKIQENAFVEWAQVYQNYYGTLKSEILRIIHEGKNCLLDVDVQGGTNIKKAFPESTLLFIAPPSLDDLRKRIESRNLDKPEVIEVRMREAIHELSFKDHYDKIIINDELEKAYQELRGLVLRVISD